MIAVLRALLTSTVLILNTVLHCAPLFLFALLKLLLPFESARRVLSRVLILIAESWIAVNSAAISVLTPLRFHVEGDTGLAYEGHYLVVSNHQSWVDIPVLQRTFNRKLPFLKFFLKSELIWVPVLGLAWWALDFPFMKRHSKAILEKRPELRGTDLETTRKACEKFRLVPVSVMNFVEGTRFTEARRDAQQSPYVHLLRPKAGGVAFVLGSMGDILQAVIDVTIVYPGGRPTFADLLCGRVDRVEVLVRELPIPKDLCNGDYDNDADFRERVQAWVGKLWADKDEMLAQRLGG